MSFSLLKNVPILIKYSNNPYRKNFRSYYKFYNTTKLDHSSNLKILMLQKKLDESRAIKLVNKINYEYITSNICLQTVEGPDFEKSVKAKSIILLFPHHDSSDESIQKITNFYHQNLLNVLVVRPQKKHFFLPETGKTVVADLIARLSGNNLPLNIENFLVHTTSSGAFFYALMCDQLSASFDLFNISRIKAQVFDGIVLGNYKEALKTYRSSVPGSLFIGEDKFGQAAERFIQQPHVADTLVYHSTDDELCKGAEELLEKWKQNTSMDVNVGCWTRSVHGQNCIRHPDKYLRALEAFLIKTGFIDHQ